jgi:hypothetical protein
MSVIDPATAGMIVKVDTSAGVIINAQGRIIVIVIIARRIAMGPIIGDDTGIQQPQGSECQNNKCAFCSLV